MKNIIINFRELLDIENFVRITEKYNFDVTLSQGKYEVNGKSLMGILSLDIIKPIEVIVNEENVSTQEFSKEIQPYVYLMKKTSIQFKKIDEVEKFVKIASKYDFDIILTQGKYKVSGKSLMGVFSLDIANPIIVVVESNDKSATAFENEIKEYII
ncbi:MAG: HPr family phosphocarrier protein [Oscillospiraceae bacterium]